MARAGILAGDALTTGVLLEAEELRAGDKATQAAQPNRILPSAPPWKPKRDETSPTLGMACGAGGQNGLPPDPQCHAGALSSCRSEIEEQIWNKWTFLF